MADHNHKHSAEEEEYKEETLATPGVLEKYQTAGKVANSIEIPFIKVSWKRSLQNVLLEHLLLKSVNTEILKLKRRLEKSTPRKILKRELHTLFASP